MCLISQSRAAGLPFEDARPLYAGARPLGMGNAFTAVADGGEAGFWNPAGLIKCQGVQVFASTKVWNRESEAFDSKSVAYCYRDTGFFWGNKIALRIPGGDVPDFTYYSLARKLNSHIAIGGSVKFERRHPCDYYQFFGHSPSCDLGILWKPNRRISSGLLIQNTKKHWISAATFGLVYEFWEKMLLSSDEIILFNEEITLESYMGWEWQLAHWIALRAGASDGDPTAGVGLKVSILRMDYAWIRNDKGNAHFISGQVKL